jgi:hypothetical protein
MAQGHLDSQNITAAQTITTTTELAVATLSPGPARLQPVGEGLTISGMVNVTQGTAGTAITVRVREGVGITGAVVGQALVYTLAAAAVASIPFTATDSVVLDNQQYSVTVQATAATGNGTVNGGGAFVDGVTTNE